MLNIHAVNLMKKMFYLWLTKEKMALPHNFGRTHQVEGEMKMGLSKTSSAFVRLNLFG